jgi:tyrosinase
MVTRKSAAALNAAEKQKFVQTILNMKSQGLYDRYVQWHSQSMQMMSAHMGPAFLPWHRSFILLFERDLQSTSGDSSLALPYWDWAADQDSGTLPNSWAVWSSDLMGGDGDPNDPPPPVDGSNDPGGIVKSGPFAAGSWQTVDGSGNPTGPLQRRLLSAPSLPTGSDVNSVLGQDPSVQPYDQAPWDMSANPSFRNALEGWINGPQLHNLVHVWVGGLMAVVPMAPNDPVFFLHHCNIDRIWASWQRQYFQNPTDPAQYAPQSGGPAGHNIDDVMQPLPGTPTPRGMFDTTALGYSYDEYVPIPARALARGMVRPMMHETYKNREIVINTKGPEHDLYIDGEHIKTFTPKAGGKYHTPYFFEGHSNLLDIAKALIDRVPRFQQRR